MPPSRQPVYGRAAVASSQPLATSAGLQTLLSGGNAVDAAIATAAALAVTEPCSNGLGGDCIALIYTASTRAITAVYGVGAAPAALTPALLGRPPVPISSAHTVTVPGAPAAWVDMVRDFGSGRPLRDVLEPALRMARHGFPVAPLTARQWSAAEPLLRGARGGHALLVRDEAGGMRAPRAGETFCNGALADSLEALAEKGAAGYYEGRVGAAIVEAVRGQGGVMTVEDLRAHATQRDEGISTTFRGMRVHEPGAPSHAAVALAALNVLEEVLGGEGEETGDEGTAAHVLVEAVRHAYAEAGRVIGGGEESGDGARRLADKAWARKVARKICTERRGEVEDGRPMRAGGTVQFCVVDRDGNAVSMVQSNYQGFGTGIVPDRCGFSLHNRGLNFVPWDGHSHDDSNSNSNSHTNTNTTSNTTTTANSSGGVNAAIGGRRPYHTIMPGLLTRNGALAGVFGVMGSFMQPQGHAQVVRLVSRGAGAQAAVDAWRWRVTGAFSAVEEGMGADGVLVEDDGAEGGAAGGAVGRALRARGHAVSVGRREAFGRGQVLLVAADGVVEGGSDWRADGCAAVLW